MPDADQGIKIPERLFYAGGAFGQNLIYTFTASYLMFFYTDILGIGAAAAGTLFLSARVFDALNDPLMGALADHTRSRIGKFRPYLLAGPPLVALVTVFCFSAFSGFAKLPYAYVSYFLWGIAYTVVDIPLWAAPSVMSSNPAEKTGAVVWSKLGGTLGQVFIVVLGIQILKLFGGEYTGGAYWRSALFLALPSCALIMLAGGFIRERVSSPAKVPFGRGFTALFSGPRLPALLAAFFLFNLTLGLRQAAQIYYTIYVLQDSNYMTWIGLSIVAGMFAGMGSAPAMMKKRGALFLFTAGCLGSGIFSLVPWYLGHENKLLLLILIGAGFFCTGLANIAWPAMLLDAIDDSQKRLGFRSEGIIFSAQTFVLKLVASVSAAAAGFSLQALGYVENAPQTPRVLRGLHFLMFLLPAILFFLSVLPMLICRRAEKRGTR